MSEFTLGVITGAVLMFGVLSGTLLQFLQLRRIVRGMARSSRRWVRGSDFDRVRAQRDAYRADAERLNSGVIDLDGQSIAVDLRRAIDRARSAS